MVDAKGRKTHNDTQKPLRAFGVNEGKNMERLREFYKSVGVIAAYFLIFN